MVNDSVRSERSTVLYVDGNSERASTFDREISSVSGFDVRTVPTADAALETLRSHGDIACIVSRHSLPSVDGVTFLESVRIQDPNVPFVLVTGNGSEDLARRAIHARVTDYFVETGQKVAWDQLASLIRQAIDYQQTRTPIASPEIEQRAILEAVPDPIVIVRDGEIVHTNEHALTVVGAEDRRDILGTSPVDLLSPDSRTLTDEILDAIQRGERNIDHVEQTCVGLDHKPIEVETTAAAIEWDESPALLLICRDISDDKEQAKRLRYFRKAVQAAGHAVYITDEEGTIEYVNPAFETMTGYQREEAAGATPRILNSGEMPDVYFEDLWETIRAGDVWHEEIINRRKDGELYYAEQTIAPIVDEAEDVDAFVAIQTDITDRKEREQALAAERSRIRAITDAIPDVVIVYDRDGRYRDVLTGGEDYLVDDKTQLLGSTVTDVLEPNVARTIQTAIEESLDAGTIQTVEYSLELAGGQTWFEGRVAPIPGEDRDEVVLLARDITERKEREQNLQYYRQAAESSMDLLTAIDTEYRYLFANETYREYHGIDTATLRGRSLADVLDAEAFATAKQHLESAFDGEIVEYEMTRPHPDLGDRQLNIRYFPVRDAAGEIVGVGAAMRDMTGKQKRLETIQRLSTYRKVASDVNQAIVRATESDALLEQVSEVVADSGLFKCTFVALTDGDHVEFACESGSEHDLDDIAGFHTNEYIETVLERGRIEIDDVTAPEFGQHTENHPSHPGVAVAISHEETDFGVLTVHFPPGTELNDTEIELLEEIADDLGYFLRNQEIDRERRERERELQAQKQRYETLFDSIRDAVLVVDAQRRIVDCNPAFTDLFGYELDEIRGKPTTVLYEDQTEFERMGEQIREQLDRPRFTKVINYQKKSGQVFPGETNVFYLRDTDDEIVGAIGLVRDISDRKRRMRQMTVIDRILRHNLRNDLHVIQAFAEMIRESTTGEAADYAQRILDNNERVQNLADEQRKITKFLSESPETETIDVVSVVEAVVAGTREQYHAADIDVSLPAECRVRAVPAVDQAIEELIENAIVHSDAERPAVSVGIERHGDTVSISVADNGPGIPDVERQVLTEDAEEPLYHGSGLGLWRVKLIVDQSDGTLEFDGNDPHGSIVTIRLPRG